MNAPTDIVEVMGGLANAIDLCFGKSKAQNVTVDRQWLLLVRDTLFQARAAREALLAAQPEPCPSEVERLRKALEGLLPGKLCGESWGLPDNESVSISVTFGALKAARTALSHQDKTEGGAE